MQQSLINNYCVEQSKVYSYSLSYMHKISIDNYFNLKNINIKIKLVSAHYWIWQKLTKLRHQICVNKYIFLYNTFFLS